MKKYMLQRFTALWDGVATVKYPSFHDSYEAAKEKAYEEASKLAKSIQKNCGEHPGIQSENSSLLCHVDNPIRRQPVFYIYDTSTSGNTYSWIITELDV